MSEQSRVVVEGVFKLFNDEGVKKKLEVMTKWEAMVDDIRNPGEDWGDRINAVLSLGKSYKVRIVVEEVSG